MRGPVIAFALGLALCGASLPAGANVSRAGWPTTHQLESAPDVLPVGSVNHRDDLGSILVGDNQNDEILGGHGNDWIYAGPGDNVLWGDAIPGDFKNQSDHIYGGSGYNVIYTGHGNNYVYAGSGRTVIHAEFGSGVISCGSGDDTVIVTNLTRPNYRLPNHCTRIQISPGRT